MNENQQFREIQRMPLTRKLMQEKRLDSETAKFKNLIIPLKEPVAVKKTPLPIPKVEITKTPVLKRSKRPSFTKRKNPQTVLEDNDEELKIKIQRKIDKERQKTELAKNITRDQIVKDDKGQLVIKNKKGEKSDEEILRIFRERLQREKEERLKQEGKII